MKLIDAQSNIDRLQLTDLSKLMLDLLCDDLSSRFHLLTDMPSGFEILDAIMAY